METGWCIYCWCICWLFFMPAITLPMPGIMWRDVLSKKDLQLSLLSASGKRSWVHWHMIVNFVQFKGRDPSEKMYNLKTAKGVKGTKGVGWGVWGSLFWWHYMEYKWKLWVKLMCTHSLHIMNALIKWPINIR